MRPAPFAVLAALVLHACATTDPLPPTTPLPAPAPAAHAFPEDALDPAELESHLRFLASDELLGRKAGTPGNNAAARYIAEQFRRYGVPPVPGRDDYLQPIPFVNTAPPATAFLIVGNDTLRQGARLLTIGGGALDGAADVVYAGHGTEADYDGLDVAGKIVVTQIGLPGDPSPQAAFRVVGQKRQRAEAHGARALVELYALSIPWPNLIGFLGGSRFELDDPAGPTLPTAVVDDANGALRAVLDAGDVTTATFTSTGMQKEPSTSSNVAGYVQGSDPALRDQYVILSAHYDHVGTGLQNGPGASPADSIFNGARDNAMGTTALLGAARALAADPPRRSVLLLAVTAEESGLLGSRYYAEHPLLPLEKAVFNLNSDGAGYSETGLVTVVGIERTTAEPQIREGAARYGFEAIGDPAPEQNLFDRSDNVNFARKGIPAPTFAPGIRSFADPVVAQYYHRPQDEVTADFDFDYLTRFAQAFTHAGRLVADRDTPPFWIEGDVYEQAGRALYGME